MMTTIQVIELIGLSFIIVLALACLFNNIKDIAMRLCKRPTR